MRSVPTTAASLAFFLIVPFAAGCSLIVDSGQCERDADCAVGASCTEGFCREATAGLLGPDYCHQIYPAELSAEAAAGEVYLVGSLLPSSGRLAERGPGRERAVFMAIDEINSAGGVDGRQLAVVACDSGSDPDQASAAVTHLASHGVPVIIGAAASDVTIAAFSDAARAAKVAMISPSSTSVLITSLPDDGLLWRTAPSDASQGIAMAELISARGYQKVGLIHLDDAYGTSLRDVMQTVLCERLACSDDEVYVSRSYSVDNFSAALPGALVALEDLDPDVVVAVGYVEDVTAFLQLMGSSTVLAGKPVILADGAKSTSLITDVSDQTLLYRLVGTNPANPDNRLSRTFTVNYRAKWAEEPTTFATHSYDAAYLVAYALAATQGTPTGPGIAEALKRLSDGDLVDVGASSFAQAASRLRSSAVATIDFNGASGSLDFDAETGEAVGNIEGWQLDLDNGEIESLGVIYDSFAHELVAPPVRDLPPGADAGTTPDAGAATDGGLDAGVDAGPSDAGVVDTGVTASDAGV